MITMNRAGANNLGADKLELFIKNVFSNEVIRAFERKCIMAKYSWTRTITSGKSCEFPVLGKASAYYHTPGDELNGQDIRHSAKVVTIDGLVVAPVYIASIDEAMNDWELRSPYADELGKGLANKTDQNLICEYVKGARAASILTPDMPAGTSVVLANSMTDADVLVDGIVARTVALEENDADIDNLFALVRPAQYHLMLKSTRMVNKDYGDDRNGVFASGIIPNIDGVAVIKSNNFPKTADSGDSYHTVDTTKTACIVADPRAVGTVKLIDLAMEQAWIPTRQATLVLGKYAMGHGFLNPALISEIKSVA